MLWYKSWLDTRWRFAIGLVVLMVVGCGTIFDWVATAKLMPLAGAVDPSTELGRRLKEALEVERTFRGFVWWQWFRQNLSQIGTLFAILLGSGSIVAAGDGAVLFTLSLPTTRARLVGVRAAVGLSELLVIVVASSLVIPVMSPAVGQRYGFGEALVHSACAFAAGAAFFSFALLLSAVFDDLWRPLLIACGVAIVLGGWELMVWNDWPAGVFHLMSGDAYFRTGVVPWTAIVVSAAVSGALMAGAASSLSRRDF
jgi:hypothetical protein